MATLYRMVTLADYSNGGIPWPAGLSANWPKGEERVLPGNIWEQLMRDRPGVFDVHFYHEPEPPAAPVEPVPDLTEPPAPDKRLAALAKARAAKAAKAAAQADKD